MLILRLLGSSSVSNNSTLINNTPVAKLYLSHIHHYFPLCDWVRRMQKQQAVFIIHYKFEANVLMAISQDFI